MTGEKVEFIVEDLDSLGVGVEECVEKNSNFQLCFEMSASIILTLIEPSDHPV